MDQINKKFSIYDYFIILVLLFAISVFLNTWLIIKIEKLKEEIIHDNQLRIHASQDVSVINLKNEALIKSHQDNLVKMQIKIDSLSHQSGQVIIKYKTKYEKVNILPDSLQYGYTDTLLAECRNKPFKRD